MARAAKFGYFDNDSGGSGRGSGSGSSSGSYSPEENLRLLLVTVLETWLFAVQRERRCRETARVVR